MNMKITSQRMCATFSSSQLVGQGNLLKCVCHFRSSIFTEKNHKIRRTHCPSYSSLNPPSLSLVSVGFKMSYSFPTFQNKSALNETTTTAVTASLLTDGSGTHLDCFWNVAHSSRIHTHEASHLRDNSLGVFKSEKQQRSGTWAFQISYFLS